MFNNFCNKFIFLLKLFPLIFKQWVFVEKQFQFSCACILFLYLFALHLCLQPSKKKCGGFFDSFFISKLALKIFVSVSETD